MPGAQALVADGGDERDAHRDLRSAVGRQRRVSTSAPGATVLCVHPKRPMTRSFGEKPARPSADQAAAIDAISRPTWIATIAKTSAASTSTSRRTKVAYTMKVSKYSWSFLRRGLWRFAQAAT